MSAEGGAMEKLGGEEIGHSSSARKVAVASTVGSTIEWYDFIAYGTAAALVFNQLFFPNFSATAGTLAAFSTFAVGFFARPVGGAVAGHFGDRVGRKAMLILTLVIMGIGTVAIGLLPTYETIGIWAPILLVLLRFVQGFATGGEWGGAALMAIEHSPNGRRGFFGSLPEIGAPAGVVLSNLAFLSLAPLSDEQFAAWGWRVPFLLSVLLVGIGLWIRLSIMESPSFARVKETRSEAARPVSEVLKTYPRQVAYIAGAFTIINATFYTLITFVPSYLSGQGVGRNAALAIVLISCVVCLFATPLFGALSDRLGRRPVYLAGAVLMGATAFPLFWLLDTGVFLVMLLGHTTSMVAMSVALGPKPTFYCEQFETRLRYSGGSLGVQIGSIFGGALAPLIAAALFSWTGTATSISVYLAALAVVAALCAYLLNETYKSDVNKEPAKPRERPLIPEGGRP